MATNLKFAAARSRYLRVDVNSEIRDHAQSVLCEDRHTRDGIERRILLAGNKGMLSMQRPQVDDDLILLTDVGKTEAIVVEVLDNPAAEEGVLLKVMTRGSFEQGQQVWIVDRDRSKVGATVEDVSKQTIDSEVTLSTVLPA